MNVSLFKEKRKGIAYKGGWGIEKSGESAEGGTHHLAPGSCSREHPLELQRWHLPASCGSFEEGFVITFGFQRQIGTSLWDEFSVLGGITRNKMYLLPIFF